MYEIKLILDKYSINDLDSFADTVNELCSKGVRNGCFQNMQVLVDILNILSICETIIKLGS